MVLVVPGWSLTTWRPCLHSFEKKRIGKVANVMQAGSMCEHSEKSIGWIQFKPLSVIMFMGRWRSATVLQYLRNGEQLAQMLGARGGRIQMRVALSCREKATRWRAYGGLQRSMARQPLLSHGRFWCCCR